MVSLWQDHDILNKCYYYILNSEYCTSSVLIGSLNSGYQLIFRAALQESLWQLVQSWYKLQVSKRSELNKIYQKKLLHSRLLDTRLVIAHSALSTLFAISYPTRTHGIIVAYSLSSNLRGICSRKHHNNRRNKWIKSSFCALLSHCFSINWNNYLPSCRWLFTSPLRSLVNIHQ